MEPQLKEEDQKNSLHHESKVVISGEAERFLNSTSKIDNAETVAIVEDIVSEKSTTFDDILVQLGEFGKYQKIIYFVLFIPTIFSAMHKMSWVFLGAKVNHRCKLPFETVVNTNHTTIPYHSEMDLSKYYNWDEDNERFEQCSWIDESKNELPCDNGWVYDRKTFGSSAVMEWNLVSL